MTTIEYLDEYIDEELLVDDQPINYNIQQVKEPPKNGGSAHENEFVQFLQAGCSKTPDVKPAKRRTKRKLPTQSSVKVKKFDFNIIQYKFLRSRNLPETKI